MILGLQLVGQRVHNYFGIGVSLQVVVALVQQLFLELFVIGKLAVEREGKPLRLAAVIAFEWLRIAPVVSAASRTAHVPDRHRAVHLRHDRLEFLAVIEAEGLGDRSHFFVSGWMSALRSGRKLAMPAASCPRFCMSSSMRGTSRATLLISP